MSAIPSTVSTGRCSRCEHVKHVRRVSRTYDYLCDECAQHLLPQPIPAYLQDLESWPKFPASAIEIRRTIEQRRKILTKGTACT